MTTKAVDEYRNIGANKSTASDDAKSIQAHSKSTSIHKDGVQFGIGADGNPTISQEQNVRITENAKEFLRNVSNLQQAKQARAVLSIIDSLLKSYNDTDFPEIAIASGDDGTIGMQWDIGDTTLGIGIDPEVEESFWFLLSGEKNKDIRAKGSLNNLEIMIPWLIYLLEKKQRTMGEK